MFLSWYEYRCAVIRCGCGYLRSNRLWQNGYSLFGWIDGWTLNAPGLAFYKNSPHLGLWCGRRNVCRISCDLFPDGMLMAVHIWCCYDARRPRSRLFYVLDRFRFCWCGSRRQKRIFLSARHMTAAFRQLRFFTGLQHLALRQTIRKTDFRLRCMRIITHRLFLCARLLYLPTIGAAALFLWCG